MKRGEGGGEEGRAKHIIGTHPQNSQKTRGGVERTLTYYITYQ